jgi:hypothetical protein
MFYVNCIEVATLIIYVGQSTSGEVIHALLKLEDSSSCLQDPVISLYPVSYQSSPDIFTLVL